MTDTPEGAYTATPVLNCGRVRGDADSVELWLCQRETGLMLRIWNRRTREQSVLSTTEIMGHSRS
jgi:hypothetical protein